MQIYFQIREMKIIVQVCPRAKQAKIEKIDDGHYRASVTAVAERGKANQALVELLAKEFNVAKSSIRIILGKTAREKLVEIVL